MNKSPINFQLKSSSTVKMRKALNPIINRLRYSQYIQSRLMAAETQSRPVQSSITKKLQEEFQPSVLQVINESHMHSVPKGSETHFKVVVVSDKFEALPLIKRHRLVNEALKEELNSGVHALSIVAKTASQWEDTGGKVSRSPPCQGGAGL